MSDKHIVKIDDNLALHHIKAELGATIKSVEWFKTGYYSRAALVETKNADKVVVRFGIDPVGYQKDKYAAQHFASPKVPIPNIKLIKELEGGVWFCISEYVDGVKSDELHGKGAVAAVSSVQETLVALHSTSISDIKGYGDFDGTGQAKYKSWSDFLTDDFCSPDFYTNDTINAELARRAWNKIGELAQLCPVDRFLVHEDFGSDNLLIKDGKVTAVLDWYFAIVGDWAMDIARCGKYPLEVYGDLKSAHEKAGFDTSNWEARINCYRLRAQIGLLNWFWDRKKQGLKIWQDLDSAQADLRSGLEKVEAGSVYGGS
jgi:aminoglycoside phosphotransferase (APT) family kinase protein